MTKVPALCVTRAACAHSCLDLARVGRQRASLLCAHCPLNGCSAFKHNHRKGSRLVSDDSTAKLQLTPAASGSAALLLVLGTLGRRRDTDTFPVYAGGSLKPSLL
jgi:hypothetical protein